MAKPKKKPAGNNIAQNKKARHEFSIEDKYEAGVMLQGWEVKSLREGRIQMTDTYVMVQRNELWWLGGIITPLISTCTHIIAESNRPRKLLMHRREIDKLMGQVDRKGYTLVPLSLYWKQGKVKMSVGLAKGKQEHDKRADSKEHDWNREKARILKHG